MVQLKINHGGEGMNKDWIDYEGENENNHDDKGTDWNNQGGKGIEMVWIVSNMVDHDGIEYRSRG